MPVDVRLLGTIEVCADGIVPLLGGPKQRAVLADLALHAGQILPTAQLIDDLNVDTSTTGTRWAGRGQARADIGPGRGRWRRAAALQCVSGWPMTLNDERR